MYLGIASTIDYVFQNNKVEKSVFGRTRSLAGQAYFWRSYRFRLGPRGVMLWSLFMGRGPTQAH